MSAHRKTSSTGQLRERSAGEAVSDTNPPARNPYNFGLDDDRCLVGKIDVAAPEIVVDGEKEYISSNKDVYGGVRLHHLRWIEE
jgi:hypothetical protein